MNEKIWTILAVTVLVLSLNLQPAKAQLFDYGIKGGVNASKLSGVDDSDYLSGFHFGAFVTIRPPMSPVAIQPELIYSRIGTEGYGLAGGETSLEIDYAQIPVLIKYYVPLPGPINPHIFAGPYVGFKVDSKWSVNEPVNGGDDSFMDDHIRDTDYGFTAGLGTEIDLMVSSIHLDFRYSHGIRSVFKGELDDGEQHRVFTLTAGFAF
ncbi:porin family protein [Balneolales bacterium ANBcel1]|nr:porin family protein [Balneolales bacterium ANBcel1]